MAEEVPPGGLEVPAALAPFAVWELGDFRIGPTGLVVPADLTFEQWTKMGDLLRTWHAGIQWLVGDWLLIGEARFGDLAAQVIDARHWSDETARTYRYVAEAVPPENRRADLSFSHHQMCSSLPPDQQKVWLERAATEEWKTPRLKAELLSARSPDVEMARALFIVCPSAAVADLIEASAAREGCSVKATTVTRSAGRGKTKGVA